MACFQRPGTICPQFSENIHYDSLLGRSSRQKAFQNCGCAYYVPRKQNDIPGRERTTVFGCQLYFTLSCQENMVYTAGHQANVQPCPGVVLPQHPDTQPENKAEAHQTGLFLLCGPCFLQLLGLWARSLAHSTVFTGQLLALSDYSCRKGCCIFPELCISFPEHFGVIL